MSSEGYNLVRTGKIKYEYCVEYVGDKSLAHIEDYKSFIEDLGYAVFYKNINLNYNIGKIFFRPNAEKGGRIATNTTINNKELLIIEKACDGKPFELRTTNREKLDYLIKASKALGMYASYVSHLSCRSEKFIFGIDRTCISYARYTISN